MSKAINCLECPIYEVYRDRCRLDYFTHHRRALDCKLEVVSPDCKLMAIVTTDKVFYPKREPDDPTWRDTLKLSRQLEQAGG